MLWLIVFQNSLSRPPDALVKLTNVLSLPRPGAWDPKYFGRLKTNGATGQPFPWKSFVQKFLAGAQSSPLSQNSVPPWESHPTFKTRTLIKNRV